MIAVGERSGQLEQMLENVARAYDTQVETRVQALTSLLEPLMIVVMGGGVGFIAFAILMPLIQMNDFVAMNDGTSRGAAMTARGEPKVFFPWEKRRGLRSIFRRARARQALDGDRRGVVTFVVLRGRESVAADVRATRAEITTAMNAVAAWRADHDRACPASLTDLVSGGYLHRVPRDAWGRPLRVVCPGRRIPRVRRFERRSRRRSRRTRIEWSERRGRCPR